MHFEDGLGALEVAASAAEMYCIGHITVDVCMWNRNRYTLPHLLSMIDKDNPYSAEGPMPALAGSLEMGASRAIATIVLEYTQHRTINNYFIAA